MQQFYSELVTGSRDINNDEHRQAYVAELRRAGVYRYVEIMQQTLTAAGYWPRWSASCTDYCTLPGNKRALFRAAPGRAQVKVSVISGSLPVATT